MSKDNLVPELRFPEFANKANWELKPFSKFIKLYRGSSPRPIREYLTNSDLGVNWIKIGDTSTIADYVIRSVSEKITPEGAKKSRSVKKGELILANSMSYGSTYLLEVEGCIYDGWFVLREYEDYFDKQFLLQLLNSEYTQSQYKKFAAGGIVQNISSEIVYNIKLPKTSKEEQQKIATCLSSLDELIAAHKDKLETLKDHKKGLLQNLFPQEGETVPKVRFPKFKGDGEWKLKQLEHVSKITTGNKDTQDKIDNGEYPFFVRSQTIERINSFSFDCEAFLTSGDGVGVGKIYHYIVGKFDFHQRVYCIYDFEKDVDGKFIFYFFSEHFYERVMRMSAKNSVDSVRRAMVTEMPISIPPTKKEQQKIASTLTAVDELISAQEDKIDQLIDHKKGLMQGLFPKT